MPVRNQTPTRFSDEIRIISPIAYFIALLAFCGIQILFATVVAHDPKAPPLLAREALGLVGGSLLAVFVLLIGYVNADAGRRGMSRLLWTLVAIFFPKCRFRLQPICPHCQRGVEHGDLFCPYCGGTLETATVREPAPPVKP